MKFSAIIGLFIGLGAIVFGNILEGGHVGSLFQFTAAIIVFGGTIGAVIVSHRWNDIERALKALPSLVSGRDEETRKQLERGKRLEELLKQAQYHPFRVEKQVIQIYVATNGLMDTIEVAKISETSNGFIEYVEQSAPELLEKITTDKEFDDAWEESVKKKFAEYSSTLSEEYFVKKEA